MTVEVVHGDCRDVLAGMPDESVDAVVTDPPYELGFMGKAWDGSGVAYNVDLWAECLRVLKPGGHLLAFGGTRTYHRMVCAIEDVGFEVRDSLHWLYGSGFPKSLDVSKAIDKAAGAERQVIGSRSTCHERPITDRWVKSKRPKNTAPLPGDPGSGLVVPVTAPATDAARQWAGFGTALKPAHEPIVVARKPLVGTVAGNVLAHGTGALNIDGCRVAGEVPQVTQGISRAATNGEAIYGGGKDLRTEPQLSQPHAAGRWPANLVFTHAADCVQVGTHDVKSSGYYPAQRGEGQATGFGKGQPDPNGARPSGNGDGTETVPVWQCADGCPVAELDGQSGARRSAYPGRPDKAAAYVGTPVNGSGATYLSDKDAGQGYADSGGASRFFTVTEWDPIADVAPFRYVAKPPKRERNAGLDGLPEKPSASAVGMGKVTAKNWGDDDEVVYERKTAHANTHPTVKPVALMRWLVRLVTPPGGTVLDPFAGSGTTLVAAVLEGFDALGIELTDDYLPIIAGRIAWAEQQLAERPQPKSQPSLFGEVP